MQGKTCGVFRVKYKLAIFDFDGTLADSYPWFIGAMARVARKYRLRELSDAELESLRGCDVPTVMSRLGVSMWKVPAISQELRRMMTADLARISLFKGMDEVLLELAQHGMMLAIVSSNAEENVRAVLGPKVSEGITYFGCGVSIFGKAAKLKKVLSKTRVAAREAIYIGDEIRDAQAAQKAGIDFGGVTWGFSTVEAIKGQRLHQLFSRVDEILNVGL